MNAPTPAAALAKPVDEVIALADIVPSKTHVQELRRARFDDKALEDLAASIRQVGVLQPIVVFPAGLAGKYEIVAGERRFLAAKRAGLATIRASVCVLKPEQVLEIQLIENLQREGLHELEEAEGYDELMKLKKINADAVADLVGKSRSYVFGRTKLLALCPEIRKAFYAGKVSASTALEFARITQPDRQVEAFRHVTDEQQYGELMTVRDIREYLREHYMLRLKTAPFDVADEKLLPKAGSCNKCPKRAGNQADLYGDVKNADVCTDTRCFDEKRQAHFAGARQAIEAKGKKVIFGDAAKKIMPGWERGDDEVAGGYHALGDQISVGSGQRKVHAIVGKDYEPVLVQHPLSGKIIEVATSQAVAKAAPQARVSGGSTRGESGIYNYGAAARRAKAKGPDVDEMLTERLAQLIHKKAPKQFGKAWFLDLAKVVFEKLNLRDDDAVAKAFGWPASAFSTSSYRSTLPSQAAKLDERGLVLLMFQMVFACRWGRERVLKLFGIKEPEIREQIIEERKAAAAKARAEAKAKKEAAKKPAPAAGKVGTKWPFPTGAKSKPKAKAKTKKKGKK